MTEMGLKHAILKRIQGSPGSDIIKKDSINLNENRRVTDFSIKRILEELPKTTKNKIDNNFNQINKNILETNIDFKLNNFNSNWMHLFYTTNSNGSVNQFGLENDLVKAKFLKLNNDSMKPNINDNNSNSNSNCSGCLDCDLYYKKFNYYQQQYLLYQNQFNSEKNFLNYYDNWLNHSIAKLNETDTLNESIEKSFVVKQQVTSINLIECKRSLEKKSKQKNEYENFIDEFSYRCQICDKVFGTADTLQNHEKSHKTPRYECIDCGKGFSQLRNYKYHISVHRGTKEFAAECQECGKTFNDKGYLSSHMKIHRNKKEYECNFCPKSFNQRVAFNMHVRIHTGVKPHKCTECGKRFSRKMLLKQHQRTHSGEKPYTCSVCGKAFADRSNMTLHHRLHSGIKPFACMLCPKAFTKKHHLKTHLNYHTGCKPYICPHKNCNQAFTQSSNMRTHAKKCQFKPPDTVL